MNDDNTFEYLCLYTTQLASLFVKSVRRHFWSRVHALSALRRTAGTMKADCEVLWEKLAAMAPPGGQASFLWDRFFPSPIGQGDDFYSFLGKILDISQSTSCPIIGVISRMRRRRSCLEPFLRGFYDAGFQVLHRLQTARSGSLEASAQILGRIRFRLDRQEMLSAVVTHPLLDCIPNTMSS